MRLVDKTPFRYFPLFFNKKLLANDLLIGQIQIWLAMAYEANNRHADCIDLYQQLEKRHPSPGIRRQASELRYILQAPKLKISQEEMVTIPMIGSSYDRYIHLCYVSSWLMHIDITLKNGL